MSTSTKGRTISATHVTVTLPNPTPEREVKSIRQICLQGFLAGKARSEIKAEIIELHPTSRAAALPAKHIAWHFGDMKKAGLLDAILKVDSAE